MLKVIENTPEGKMAKEIHRLFISHLREDDRGGITDNKDRNPIMEIPQVLAVINQCAYKMKRGEPDKAQ